MPKLMKWAFSFEKGETYVFPINFYWNRLLREQSSQDILINYFQSIKSGVIYVLLTSITIIPKLNTEETLNFLSYLFET